MSAMMREAIDVARYELRDLHIELLDLNLVELALALRTTSLRTADACARCSFPLSTAPLPSVWRRPSGQFWVDATVFCDGSVEDGLRVRTPRYRCSGSGSQTPGVGGSVWGVRPGSGASRHDCQSDFETSPQGGKMIRYGCACSSRRLRGCYEGFTISAVRDN